MILIRKAIAFVFTIVLRHSEDIPMTLQRNIAAAFSMSDDAWLRHANPWSGWTRFITVLPQFDWRDRRSNPQSYPDLIK